MELQELINKASTEQLSLQELTWLTDFFNEKRTARLALDKEVAKLATDESQAKDLLIQQMLSQGVGSLGSSSIRVTLGAPEQQPSVKDWNKLYEYIKDNDAFELLERRPGKVAFRERWENGEVIPGVEQFPVYKLTTSKVK